MTARSRATLLMFILPMLGMLTAETVSASPGDAGTSDTQACQFTLSKPELSVLTGGAQAVTATARTTACTGLARPQKVTVCVATAGTNGYCTSQAGWNLAKAIFPAATTPSGSYTATAVGCYNDPSQPLPVCTTLPNTSTTF